MKETWTSCDSEWSTSRKYCVWTDDSIDSGLETEAPDRLATYIMMDARDQLNITLTPAGMQVLHDLAIAFTHSIPDIPSAAFHGLEAPLSLQNDLGPWAKITLLSRAEVCYSLHNLLLHCHLLIPLLEWVIEWQSLLLASLVSGYTVSYVLLSSWNLYDPWQISESKMWNRIRCMRNFSGIIVSCLMHCHSLRDRFYIFMSVKTWHI